MGFYKFWKHLEDKTRKNNDKSDVTFPEKKGKVTIEAIKKELTDIDDAVFKELSYKNEKVTLIHLSSMIDKLTLDRDVYKPLEGLNNTSDSPIELLRHSEEVKEDQLPQTIQDIVEGYTVLFFNNNNLILKVNTYGVAERGVETPESESTVLGPQDGFTESIETNWSLIKRRIHSPHLKTKKYILGTETRNSVSVMYMDNIANAENVKRVIYRVQNIEFQGFTGMAILKQMLEDKPYSPFPQFGITARPDNAVGALLDGRILVMINGSPEVAICPSTFFELFNSPEDFYNRWTTASLLRSLRFGGLFISILLTSSYISVLTYHQEMLPPALLTLLAESRTKVPFPPVLEVLIIELVIEVLREAGARMPTKIGQTIGIVGGIVIGTAAVEAGLSSNILIVLVSVSALLSFTPANFLMSNAIRFTRYIFILAAGMFGMYGQMLALAWLFVHLLNMTSLGTPYLAPVLPRAWSDLANSMLRAPINFIMSRSKTSRAKKELTRPLDEE